MACPIILVAAATPPVALRVNEGLARYGDETLVVTDEADPLALIEAARRVGVLVADLDAGTVTASRGGENRPTRA